MASPQSPPAAKRPRPTEHAEGREKLIAKVLEQDRDIYLLEMRKAVCSKTVSPQDALAVVTGTEQFHRDVVESRRKRKELTDALSHQAEELGQAWAEVSGLPQGHVDPVVMAVVQNRTATINASAAGTKRLLGKMTPKSYDPSLTTAGKRLMSKCRMLERENTELQELIRHGSAKRIAARITLAKLERARLQRHVQQLEALVGELDDEVQAADKRVQALRDCGPHEAAEVD